MIRSSEKARFVNMLADFLRLALFRRPIQRLKIALRPIVALFPEAIISLANHVIEACYALCLTISQHEKRIFSARARGTDYVE